MRGLSFEIPNTYGKVLFDILSQTKIKDFVWKVGNGESYAIENDTLGNPLFPIDTILSGEQLFKRISAEDYYVIFADLKGFLREADVRGIATYEEFVESDCQVVLLIVDSSFVYFYSKDQAITKAIYSKAIAAGYKNVEYITDENDELATLIAF